MDFSKKEKCKGFLDENVREAKLFNRRKEFVLSVFQDALMPFSKKEDACPMEDIQLGDIIKTKKTHPCGGDTWEVIRTGADIKMKCQTCGRVVMLDRLVFIKRRKKTLSHGEGLTCHEAPLPKTHHEE